MIVFPTLLHDTAPVNPYMKVTLLHKAESSVGIIKIIAPFYVCSCAGLKFRNKVESGLLTT